MSLSQKPNVRAVLNYENYIEYLKCLLEHRTNKDMSDDKLAKLAPWSEEVQEKCSKMLACKNPGNRVPRVRPETMCLPLLRTLTIKSWIK